MQRLLVLVQRLNLPTAELCSATVINCSAIEFWQGREAGYPPLPKIALDLISAPASQAYTERVCSVSVGIWRRASATGWPEGWNGVFSCDWTWNTSELNWTEQNCDEPVECTELVTIVRDWEWECCWWWWHWVTMIMIMMSHAMLFFNKSVTTTW